MIMTDILLCIIATELALIIFLRIGKSSRNALLRPEKEKEITKHHPKTDIIFYKSVKDREKQDFEELLEKVRKQEKGKE